jgi:hypothetical protein
MSSSFVLTRTFVDKLYLPETGKRQKKNGYAGE